MSSSVHPATTEAHGEGSPSSEPLDSDLIEIRPGEDGKPRVFLRGEDISSIVQRVSMYISPVSTTFILEILGQRLELKTVATEAKLKWK